MKVKNICARTIELPSLSDKAMGCSIQPGETVDVSDEFAKHEVIALWMLPEQKMLEVVHVKKEVPAMKPLKGDKE